MPIARPSSSPRRAAAKLSSKSSEKLQKSWEKKEKSWELFAENTTVFGVINAQMAATYHNSQKCCPCAFVQFAENQYLCRWLPYAQPEMLMYYISKRIEIAYAHQLKLDYESKCTRPHGHNGIVTVYCCAEELNEYGMVVDFTHVKQRVQDKLDHRNVNEILDFNTTAENMARWICEQIPNAYKVSFQESEGNVAVYVKPGFENAAL